MSSWHHFIMTSCHRHHDHCCHDLNSNDNDNRSGGCSFLSSCCFLTATAQEVLRTKESGGSSTEKETWCHRRGRNVNLIMIMSSPSVWSHGHHRRSWRGGSFCLRGTGSTGRGRQHQLPLSGWLTTLTSSSSLTSSPSWTSSSSCQSLISSSSSTQCHCEDINNINCHWHITSIAYVLVIIVFAIIIPVIIALNIVIKQTDRQQQGYCFQASTSRPVTERRILSTRTFRPRARPDNFVSKSWNSKNDDDDNLQTNKMLWKLVRSHRWWENEYL